MAVLRAMNADQPDTPEARAESEEAVDAFRAACNGNLD